MLRSLIFDLGGVIVPCDFSRGYAAIEKLCPYAAKDIPRRIAAIDGVSSAALRNDRGRTGAPPNAVAHRAPMHSHPVPEAGRR